MARLLSRAATALLLAVPAAAHDLWIAPESYTPTPGSLLAVHLSVGEHGVGQPVARSEAKIERFVLVGAGGERALVGLDGKEPAGSIRLEGAGLGVIGYRSKNSRIELEPAKFEAYLGEEGLERVSAERERLGESTKPGRELYSRCAKALIRVGGEAQGGHERALGFPLELIPRSDPFVAADASGTCELRLGLLHQGRPLEGALVRLVHLDSASAAGATELRARTDADGQATFQLPRRGCWLATSVHMTRVEGSAEADWQSLWASLTFELP